VGDLAAGAGDLAARFGLLLEAAAGAAGAAAMGVGAAAAGVDLLTFLKMSMATRATTMTTVTIKGANGLRFVSAAAISLPFETTIVDITFEFAVNMKTTKHLLCGERNVTLAKPR
jgi:hypothetical protein